MARFANLAWLFVLAPLACATGVTNETGGTTGAGQGGGGGDASTTAASTTMASSSTGSSGPCTSAAQCASLSDQCNVGTCINGACSKMAANDLGACDDGKTCTDNDSCQAGLCTGTSKFCPSSDPCHVGSCDSASDGCVEVPGNDGAACVDQDPCTLTGVCSAGVCTPGQQVDCSFLDSECGVGLCDSQLGCVAMPLNDGAPCNDGFFCTIDDVCTNSVCGGVPNTCAPPGADICTIGSCNEATDSCVAVPGNNGMACNDASSCTVGEVCSNGLCGGGAPANQGGGCNDGSSCTTNDTCNNGVCSGSPVACLNGDGCCPPQCNDVNDDDCGAVEITVNNDAYGHHGQCMGWNECNDAATCALWACQINGYATLFSYGVEAPCDSGQFSTCHLFYGQGPADGIEMNWGTSCAVMGVSDIFCK